MQEWRLDTVQPREWMPERCPDLRELLSQNQTAREYFYHLPMQVRSALGRQESITSFAQMQSFAADELENFF